MKCGRIIGRIRQRERARQLAANIELATDLFIASQPLNRALDTYGASKSPMAMEAHKNFTQQQIELYNRLANAAKCIDPPEMEAV